jgi:hypothetical protein
MSPRTLPCIATLCFGVLAVLSVGCRKEEPQAPTQFQGDPNATAQPYTTAAPVDTTATTAVPAAGAVQPGPFAPACTILEGTCGYARCNMAVGKCSWPCGSNNDCVAGSTCIGAGTMLATCGPALGVPAPQ